MRTTNDTSKNGFTVVEILIAMGVFMLVLAAVLPMYVQSSKTILKSDSKLDISDDIRRINDKIIHQSKIADAFIIYDSFKNTLIDGTLQDFRLPINENKGRRRDGESGNFLLLVTFGEDEHPDDANPAPLSSIFGVYLEPDGGGTKSSLKYFSKSFTPPVSTSIESNIPSYGSSSSHKVLIKEMEGLIDGNVFFNFSGRSVMLSGKIIHLNNSVAETNTYNFTITPR